MNLKFFKNYRLIFMFSIVLVSIFLINPFPKKGVVVVSVSSNSSLYNKVQPGEYITWANEKEIKTPEDLYDFNNFVGSFRFMHSGKLDIVQVNGNGLGIVVSKPSTSNINFGLDIVGGTRALLKTQGENVTDVLVQQVINILETRINVFGLKEAKIQQINDVSGDKFIQIEMAGGSKEEIENLLAKQGKFEGKIPIIVKFANNTGTLRLDKDYKIEYWNNSIIVNSTYLKENETSAIEGVNFQVQNLTESNVTIMFSVFKGIDIQSVCLQEQSGICVSRITQQTDGWEFNFQVFITQEAAERFAKVTKNMQIITDPNSGQGYLESKISLYLDENLITSLNIGKDLKGKAYTTPVITGFRTARADAFKEQLRLKSILQSGSLPVTLKVLRIDEISPVLGSEFISAAMMSALVAAVAVAAVILIRYRNFKILLIMMVWSVSEFILTLGAASVIKWTMDLSSIAGLIAAIGTGTNDQIVIIDEILLGGSEEKAYTTKQKIKRAFFIVFGAAGTTTASMLPLLFIGVGVLKGFAIVTIIGVLIGVVITRPAFAIVAEKILEKKQ